jgi:polyhydroxyalkanoate synthase
MHAEGTARLLRFRRAAGGAEDRGPPVLLVPSLINRWYVLDLRPGASLAGALVGAGLDTWCLDWGIPEDEDRYLTWDDVLDRLRRAVRFVRRATGAPRVSLLGYCMGGTLAGIHAALHPDEIAALVNLAGPFDFARGGFLKEMCDPRWFDVDAIAAAGNVSPYQMQSGFVALRPTQQLAKWVGFVDRAHDPAARESFEALEAWAGDNVPFPAAAYTTYIRELYQENRLVGGTHHVKGRRVDLGAIRCPVLVISADRDTICPPDAARAVVDHCTATSKEVVVVPGGHVGAVVGSRAPKQLYPKLVQFFQGDRSCSSPS